MDQPSQLPRPSGLPRPAASRLPVLRPSASQSQLRASSSNTQLRKKPSVASLSRPAAEPAAQPTSRAAAAAPALAVQRKPSRISLVPSYTPTPTPAITAAAAAPGPKPSPSATLSKRPSRASLVPSAARRVSSIPNSGPPPRTSSQNAPAFKKPFARPPSRQTRTPPQPLRTPSTSREDDGLGSLDGFRSASRASSRAGSRAGFHESSSSPECLPDLDPAEVAQRKPRPSLSERTVESLAQLPSSPANAKGRRRRSSFFNQDNSMPPTLRPASGMSNRSSGSRPTTSDGPASRPPVTPSKSSAPPSRVSMTVPGKRTSSANFSTPTTTPSRISSLSRPATAIKKPALVPLHNTQTPSKPAPLSISKSAASRTPSTRPSVAGSYGQAISPPGTAPAPSPAPAPAPASARKAPNSSLALRNSIAQAKAARRQEAAESPENTPKKAASSSNALREQIAKAREAAKRNKAVPERADTPPKDAIIPNPDEIAGFDFGLEDPFNQSSKAGQSVMRKRVDGARTTGRLNIAGMQLTEMPDEVLRMYDPNDTAVAWGEIVDVTTIIAADNDIKLLPDSMFPDIDINDLIDSDDAGPQFGGVQTLDLHGNLLQELPLGLRRLAELTKLNLSRNKLSIEAFDVITQIAPLRELKISENDLVGALPSSIANLAQLETLDVANNKLIELPVEIQELTQLRAFNVADNQLRSIPVEVFSSTSLIELIATRNRLEGAFFSVKSAPCLQDLRLAGNALTSLSESGEMDLPALRYLDVSSNRLSKLPTVSSWLSLNTLLVGENKVTVFPEGFFSLQQLRIADFTANDISKVDERIALMERLENLTLAANPIRERKFLTMSTDDMKRDLYTRLQPEHVTACDEEDEHPTAEQAPEGPNGWTVTPSGTLDLASKGFTELDEEAMLALSETSDIRQINLQGNLLQTMPLAFGHISFLTILDLSKNSISSPLMTSLELPKLRELRFSGNRLSAMTSLTSHLTAPALQSIDVSQNRLTGSLPSLRDTFPALITLIASDNVIVDVPADSLYGLKVVNLSNNSIERLDPRIGLHAGTLTSFMVEGNRFRVPNYQVLSKGTDATLSWLKDKVPRENGRGRGDSGASTATRTTEGGSEFFDAEDGAETW